MTAEVTTTPDSATPNSLHPDQVLAVRGLRIRYETGSDPVEAVRGVSFDLARGETLGIVGESGSGKSTTVLGAVGLLAAGARATEGQVLFQGRDLLRASAAQMRNILGADIGVIYQDALRSLNPVMRVGKQIQELLAAHGQRRDAALRAVAALGEVGIPDPQLRSRNYPHEFSGGMRQRAMIAMGMALHPALLIADEPTTAVDVTIQAQILALMKTLAADHGTATILVSHDLGVIANMCDRVLVMYAGEIVEQGPVAQLFAEPRHPYTRSLLNATPDLAAPRQQRLAFIPGQPPNLAEQQQGCAFAARCFAREDRCEVEQPTLAAATPDHFTACLVAQARGGTIPQPPATAPQAAPLVFHAPLEQDTTVTNGVGSVLVQLEQVTRAYQVGTLFVPRRLVAVDSVDLAIAQGTTLGLVGESGSGKSTLGRIIVGLERADSGCVRFAGTDISGLDPRALRRHRRRAQMIFQDPVSSLNRAKTIGQLLGEPLRQNGVAGKAIKQRSVELLELVGLPGRFLTKGSFECSGGQAQRVAIARALAVGAEVLVADEAVSSLDVSVKGQVLNLLKDLQRDVGLTVLFISHDLSVVREVCDQVAVMYLGSVVEVAATEQLFSRVSHPYTEALRSAISIPDPVRERSRRHIILPGDTPSPTAIPSGCRFHSRCHRGPVNNPERTICRSEVPLLEQRTPGCLSACHFATELKEG